MPKKAQIFISYARSDNVAVNNIYERLANLNSIKPWMDVRDLLGGEKWEPVIKKAIRDSQLFLLCLSRNSIQRRGVLQKEVKTALDVLNEKLDEDVFLIPTWIEPGVIPVDDIPENLSEYEFVNLSDPGGWDKLIKSIEVQLKKLGNDVSSAGLGLTSIAGAPSIGTDFETDEFIEELKQALADFDGKTVAANCQLLLSHLRRADNSLPERDGSRILRYLSRNNLFDYSGAIADALLLAAPQARSFRSFYALSLLERGLLKAPLTILEDLVAETSDNPTTQAEIGKLLGRTYTRIYLDAEDASGSRIHETLRRAVESYLKVYSGDPKRYLLHGSRAAAIMMRAERDGKATTGFRAPPEVAQAVLDELVEREEFRESVTASDSAAAVEACLALGRHDGAVIWLHRFLDHQAADVSALEDLYRQLQDVWQLKPGEEPGSSLLPILGQKIEELQKAWQSAPALIQPAEPRREPDDKLGTLFGVDSSYTLLWYKEGLDCANSVARVERLNGAGVATGFVVSGKDMHPALGDELVFLTAAYVLTDQKTRAHLPFAALDPENAQINFTTLGNDNQYYRIKEILWSSFTKEMDATVIRLDAPSSRIQPCRIAKPLTQRTGYEHVYLIGHPWGRDLEYFLQDSLLLDQDETRLHYRTPSEPGSGGCPAFNDNWELIGLHHKSSEDTPRLNGKPGTYAANEAISIFAIIDAFKSNFIE